MIRLSRIAVSAAVAALAISALGAPVAAADPKVAIVHGIPGKRADICVDGKQIKGGMRYGNTIFRRLPAGDHTIKVLTANAVNCRRGTVLLKQDVTLVEDANVTAVATKRAPKLLVFDNSLGTQIFATDFYFRHAADLGPVVIGRDSRTVSPLTPAAPTPFEKGEQLLTELANTTVRAIAQRLYGRVFAASKWVTTPLVTVVTDDIGDSSAEFILVGTNQKNARFVTIDRS